MGGVVALFQEGSFAILAVDGLALLVRFQELVLSLA